MHIAHSVAVTVMIYTMYLTLYNIIHMHMDTTYLAWYDDSDIAEMADRDKQVSYLEQGNL